MGKKSCSLSVSGTGATGAEGQDEDWRGVSRIYARGLFFYALRAAMKLGSYSLNDNTVNQKNRNL
jgi:hypothetical protein